MYDDGRRVSGLAVAAAVVLTLLGSIGLAMSDNGAVARAGTVSSAPLASG